MARISKQEQERRATIKAKAIKEVHKALDKAAHTFGDPKAFRKAMQHNEIVESALGTWRTPAAKTAPVEPSGITPTESTP